MEYQSPTSANPVAQPGQVPFSLRRWLVLAGASAAALLVAAPAVQAQSARGAAAAPASYASVAEAARSRDWTAVRAMAAAPGADLAVLTVDGSAALHWASSMRQPDVVRDLLARGAAVDQPNLYGATPLILAINNGDTATVKALLDGGANAAALEQNNESMVMLAVRQGDAEMVDALIAKGADVDYAAPLYGQTATMIAVLLNKVPALEVLIKAGADLEARTTPGPEPYVRPPGAGGSRGEGIVRSGVPPQGQRVSGIGLMGALHYAARDGRLEAARALIEAGADVNLVEYNEMTPLVTALINDNHDVAKLLIEAGADVNEDDWWGREPLWAAVESRNRESINKDNGIDRPLALEVITMLLDKGADVNGRVERFPTRPGGHSFNMSWVPTVGETALFKAALTGDVTVMRLLLARGADPHIVAYNGTTALMLAAGVNWVWRQTWNDGGEENQLEAVKMLVELGGDVNEVNEMGLSPVMGAAHRNSARVIEYLVEQGARLDLKDEIGRDALTWANGVYLASDAPEPHPAAIEAVERLLAEGKGVGDPQQASNAPGSGGG